MHPWHFIHEFTDEHSAGDRSATLAVADVLNIRDRPLDHLAVLIVHRHGPHFFARILRARQQFICERLIRPKYSGVDSSQRHDDRAGERRCIHEMRAAKFPRISNSVRQDQPPFRVGIQHFDALS